ncbi:MAG: hypothetical protein HY719_01345 [Planctomycetes bacterium]|nr:hypothetical protein [Planctomycetota bacterium]
MRFGAGAVPDNATHLLVVRTEQNLRLPHLQVRFQREEEGMRLNVGGTTVSAEELADLVRRGVLERLDAGGNLYRIRRGQP